jgi:hypothetical protein
MAGWQRDVERLAGEHGWTVSWLKKGHGELTKPGYPAIRCAGSPNNRRVALGAIERDIRRRENGYYQGDTHAHRETEDAAAARRVGAPRRTGRR